MAVCPDGIKAQLAQSALPQRLLVLLAPPGGEEEDRQSTEKLAADLVVLILTGGGCFSLVAWDALMLGNIISFIVSCRRFVVV